MEQWIESEGPVLPDPFTPAGEPVPAYSYMHLRNVILAQVHDCITAYFNSGSLVPDWKDNSAYESFVSIVHQDLCRALAADRLDDPRRR